MYKKQRNCDPADPDDDHRGDYWDHVAFDPEHKPIPAAPGARAEENARAIVAEVEQRATCEPPPLMTGDEYPACAAAIPEAFSGPVPAPPGRESGRPRVMPERRLPGDVTYAAVHKERENDRVIAVEQGQVFGSPEGLEDPLGEPVAGHRVNTSLVERRNGTDRGRNARKARKTYRFSKGWRVHEAMTYLTLHGYDFRWRVRTSRVKGEGGGWRERSPAFAAGLTDHVWTWKEWFSRSTVQST